MRIETARLVLRRWQPTDADGLAEIYADPAIVRWLGPLTRDDAAITVERYEHHWRIHGFGRFAVEDRQTGRLVGRVGVMRQPDWTATPEQDEAGWVVRRDRWGEGLATEAAASSIAHVFDRVGLERVVSWTTPDNVASRRVMEKCGLRFRGTTDWKGTEQRLVRRPIWQRAWLTVSDTGSCQAGDCCHGRSGRRSVACSTPTRWTDATRPVERSERSRRSLPLTRIGL